jgi:hypothetical protein
MFFAFSFCPLVADALIVSTGKERARTRALSFEARPSAFIRSTLGRADLARAWRVLIQRLVVSEGDSVARATAKLSC